MSEDQRSIESALFEKIVEADLALAELEMLLKPVIERNLMWLGADPATAAEVAHDSIVLLWVHRSEVPVHHVRKYALGIARNQLKTRGRSERASRAREEVWSLELPSPRSPLDDLREVEVREWIEAEIEDLPARKREVFRLRMLDGLSTDETAKMLRIDARTVENLLYRAKKSLRLALGAEYAAFFGDLVDASKGRASRA